MEELDAIVADVETTMTPLFHRAFLAAGCDPACHCCDKVILIGDVFKLAHIEDVDEMLCKKCTPKKFLEKIKAATKERERLNRGFTRPHA